MEYWTLSSQGDPLGNLRKLVKHVWLETDLKGMLITANNGESKTRAMPRFITDVELIDQLNPFTPLMEVNIARLIPGILADNPGTRIGALLRPCEMRALIEMTKHTPLNLENLLTISVDCLGTLPADEYQWRLERLEKSHSTPTDKPIATDDELAHEALAFARQGGIIPYRYRSACQVCTSPAANQAEININVLGLPIRQQMLLSFNAPGTAEAYHLDKLITGVADKSLVSQHERILSKMCERHANTMERVNESLGNLLPADLDAVIHQLESCGDCQVCMDVCPICSVDRPYRDAQGHYGRKDVMRWLVSCAGCGMCEQSCPNNLPTSAIFAHIRHRLTQEWEYVPGRSVDEPLPVM